MLYGVRKDTPPKFAILRRAATRSNRGYGAYSRLPPWGASRWLRGWRLVRYLEEGGGVGDVVADEALCGDTDLVLADGGGLGPRLLDPLVPIHGSFLRRCSR